MWRVLRIVGISLLVLFSLTAALAFMVNQVRIADQLELLQRQRQVPFPEAEDPRVDDLQAEVDDLNERFDGFVDRVQNEVRYICSQFTAVDCLDFPTGSD